MDQGFRQYGVSQQAFVNNADPRTYRARFVNRGQAVNYRNEQSTNEEDQHWQAVAKRGLKQAANVVSDATKQAAKVVTDATSTAVNATVDAGTNVHKNVEDNVAIATDQYKQKLYNIFGEQNVNNAYYGSQVERDYNTFKTNYDTKHSSTALKPVGDSIKNTTRQVGNQVTNACCIS